jgi:tRNA 2-thiouridine synthesizing protein E
MSIAPLLSGRPLRYIHTVASMTVNAAKAAVRVSGRSGGRPRRGEDNSVMAIEFDGRTIATTATGYLENLEEWSEELACHMARQEGIELSNRHWDVLRYLREEFFANNGHQPNTRTIVKAMSEQWGEEVDQRALYDLFPRDPSKQAGRIAGLPESRRKGGY